MSKRFILMLLVVIFLPFPAGADSDGSSSANFLKIGVGARAVGLGGAYTAIAEGASAAYWNPAGISGQEQWELLSMYGSWLAGATYQYLGIVKPASDWGSWGLSYGS